MLLSYRAVCTLQLVPWASMPLQECSGKANSEASRNATGRWTLRYLIADSLAGRRFAGSGDCQVLAQHTEGELQRFPHDHVLCRLVTEKNIFALICSFLFSTSTNNNIFQYIVYIVVGLFLTPKCASRVSPTGRPVCSTPRISELSEHFHPAWEILGLCDEWENDTLCVNGVTKHTVKHTNLLCVFTLSNVNDILKCRLKYRPSSLVQDESASGGRLERVQRDYSE